jgi:hypothetical protein
MALAFAAAAAVVPFVQRGCATWEERWEHEWTAMHQSLVVREQRWCRLLARLVRHTTLTAAALAVLRRRPAFARPVLAHLAPPGSLH